jgi:hypothetical protein
MINLQAAAHSRAHQIARGAVEEQIRADGRKVCDIAMGELRCSIERYLAQHPECFQRAAEDIERWILEGRFGKACRTKLTSGAQKRSR